MGNVVLAIQVNSDANVMAGKKSGQNRKSLRKKQELNTAFIKMQGGREKGPIRQYRGSIKQGSVHFLWVS